MSKTTQQVNVRLSKDLRERLQALQKDPLTSKTRYGSMTQLIESLLWKWVAEQSAKPKEPFYD